MPDGATGKRFLRHLALDGARRYLDASTIFTTHDRSRLLTADAAAMMADCDPLAASLAALGTAGRSWLSSLQYCDLRNYLPLDILVKVDRMTMAHSIEARPVLLDHRLVECAARLPWTMKLRGATTKYLFKRALRGLVPDDIIDRRETGVRRAARAMVSRAMALDRERHPSVRAVSQSRRVRSRVCRTCPAPQQSRPRYGSANLDDGVV